TDHDNNSPSGPQFFGGAGKYFRNVLLIGLPSGLAGTHYRRANFLRTSVFETEQVIGVDVLLMIVNQTNVRRARNYAVQLWYFRYAAIAVDDSYTCRCSQSSEFFHPAHCVQRISPKELPRVRRGLA